MIAAVGTFSLLAGGIVMLAGHWPFTRHAVTQSLEEAFSAAVEIQAFQRVFFPYPGCILHGVTIRSKAHRDRAPLIRIEWMAVRGDYYRLLTLSKHLRAIRVSGLDLHIPPRGSGRSPSQKSGDSSIAGITADEFVAERATLNIETKESGADPYLVSIRTVRLQNVGVDRAFSFETELRLATPPADIRARGRFGPWNRTDPFDTAVSTSYSVERLDLSFAKGIAGVLTSQGAFRGPLHRIEIAGSVTVPNFEVTDVRHEEPIGASFRALVNGETGDTTLMSVDAQLRHTTIRSSGKVMEVRPAAGKAVSLEISVPAGRVEDLLYLLARPAVPGMTGDIRLSTRALLPPGDSRFASKLEMNGEFEIKDARFTGQETRHGLARISERARGGKGDEPEPPDVPSSLRGKVVVNNGTATVTGALVAFPGASARLAGTYNLINTRVDLHGRAHLDVELSKTQRGAKSFFLKAIDPFFRGRRRRSADVPIKITGRYGHIALGLDILK